MPIDERLREAVSDAAAMRSHGALRRQKLLIRKLMREADITAIRRILDEHDADERLARRVFANAEAWRDRVIDDGATAVADFHAYSGTVDTTLDGLLERLRTARNERAVKQLRREIFRVIHAALVTQAQNDRISQ